MENEMLFFELSSDELTILASLVALGLSKGLNVEQINILGNFIVAVGSLMTTIAAQEEALIAQKEKKQNSKQENNVQQQIIDLQKKVQEILDKK